MGGGKQNEGSQEQGAGILYWPASLSRGDSTPIIDRTMPSALSWAGGSSISVQAATEPARKCGLAGWSAVLPAVR